MFSVISLESFALLVFSLFGALFSSVSFRNRDPLFVEGEHPEGTHENFALIPAFFAAIFVNPLFAFFLALISEVTISLTLMYFSGVAIWKSNTKKRLSILAFNLSICLASLLVVDLLFRLFSRHVDHDALSASLAILSTSIGIFTLEIVGWFIFYRSIRQAFEDLVALTLDVYVVIASLLVAIVYLRYDFLAMIEVLFIVVVILPLLMDWFVKTELTLMGFQAELAGIEGFALREDIRQFPGLVKHEYRVSAYAGLMAQKAGHSLQIQRFVRTCGLMHEAGTIETLKRENTHPSQMSEYAKLDPEIMQRALQERVYSAPTIGGTILADLREYAPVDQVIIAHRETPDGTGFPYRLIEQEIPDEALLLGVANEFDVLTTIGIVDPKHEPLDLHTNTKQQHKPLTARQAIEHLQKHAGTKFSKKYVDLLEQVMKEREYRLVENIDSQQILSGYTKLREDIQERRLTQGPISYAFTKLFGLSPQAVQPVNYLKLDGVMQRSTDATRLYRQTVIGKLITDKIRKREQTQHNKHQQQIDQDIQRLFEPDLQHPTEQEDY